MDNDPKTQLANDLVWASSRFARTAYQATPVQLSYVSLRAMAAINREPGLRVGELARLEGITQPSMSQAIKKLVDDNLITRHPSPEDARATDLMITDKGRDILQKYRADSAAQIVPVLDTLDDDDIAVLKRASELLQHITEELAQNR
ncbi:MarR family winged helix-turn-helix transcriptional regulator [Corynebacterium sp. p3-SID1056]|uniref:MarR family winged helix-turn-helix transcriptional regulator n=1 Tax=Corynebacterium sp. p3-SID1056 TaxID=2916092 RepID=UPI0021A56F85|nr:MarR family transcriptional regulator [Corynebacterium sp. p3-SID1056]MCT2338708.1 MarR family transcriptional regulator [Corynebacterium sp. p3-SID1056]